MALDGAAMIASLGGAAYTVTRYAVSTVLAGRKVAGATSSVPITALIGPLTGKDRALLGEGVGSDATVGLYTSTLLYSKTEAAGGDRLTFQGDVYEVIRVAPWILSGAYVCALEKVTG